MTGTATAPRRACIAAMLAASLAACAGTMSSSLTDVQPAPKIDMNGRWLLSGKSGPPCGMAFRAAADGQSGAIAPEGGCPENFFTSRAWSFESGELLISNHNAEALGHLRFAGGKFEGQSTGGQPITLMRPNPPPAPAAN